MPTLSPNEYDQTYFDGKAAGTTHPAGYSSYQRWSRHDGEGSAGEYWKDIATKLLNEQSIHNLTVLEIGCAKGFVVEDLNDLGVDCFGVDVSSYAIGQAKERRPDLASKFINEDATFYLSGQRRNAFDFVFSIQVLECLSDAQITSLITQLNRTTKRNQVHIIGEYGRTEEATAATYYNVKTKAQWQQLGFATGTQILTITEFRTLFNV